MIYEEIDNWLKCNIREISIESILDNRNLVGSVMDCAFTSSGVPVRPKINDCINGILQLCIIAKIKVIKFIRFRVKYSLVLLKKYEDMKIIHLVRDARGIFSSRIDIGPNPQLFSLLAQKYCSQVAEDLTFSLQIFKQFPNKIRIIRFENIAEIPEETTKAMFNFTGLPFSKDILEYVKNHTNANSDNGRHGVSRQNANLTVNKWRYTLNLTTVNQLDMYCRKSNYILGYLPLTTLQSFRNYSQPSRTILSHQGKIFI